MKCFDFVRIVIVCSDEPANWVHVQIQGSLGHPMRYGSMLDAVQKIRAEEGVKALYRGTLSSFMKVGLTHLDEAVLNFRCAHSHSLPRNEALALARANSV